MFGLRFLHQKTFLTFLLPSRFNQNRQAVLAPESSNGLKSKSVTDSNVITIVAHYYINHANSAAISALTHSSRKYRLLLSYFSK